MKNYKKSNCLLIFGSIYGVILACLIITYGVIYMRSLILANAFDTYPLINLIPILLFLFSIIMVLYGLASLVGVIFGIIAMSKHKRGNYRACLILSGLTINPLSIFGALNGIDTLAA